MLWLLFLSELAQPAHNLVQNVRALCSSRVTNVDVPLTVDFCISEEQLVAGGSRDPQHHASEPDGT